MSKQDQPAYLSLYTQDTNSDNLIVNTDPQSNQKDTIEKFLSIKSDIDFIYKHTEDDHYSGTLSPSSSLFNMHMNHLPPTPSSSSSRFIPEPPLEEDLLINNSLLMKKALKAEKKRRDSMGEVSLNQRRYITPRLSRSSILQNSSKKIACNSQAEQQKDDHSSGVVHWDPHIDTFEILRAKITGITRAMQEFHVQELFQDELLADERRKRISSFPKATNSSPLIPSRSNKTLPSLSSVRRSSLVDTSELSHRRIRSQSSFPISVTHEQQEDDSRDEDEELEGTRLLKSPNLSALFLTTNNLIHSRLDELSEAASIKSNKDSDVTGLLEWQKQFLNLVTSCIHQSEELESLSTDILTSEHRVRELMLINETLYEQFQQRERQYEERIRECQEVAQQQLMMIDSLEELTADINMKIETHQKREAQRQDVSAVEECLSNRNSVDSSLDRWNFQRPIADLMQMDDKFDLVQKMRWEIGMFVGGGVGTGHVIHAFESKLNGFDMIIAGTGTTTSSPITSQHPYFETSSNSYPITSCSVSPSLHHLQLYQYRYLLHINRTDRKTRFRLLPKSLWVPDHQVDQCQFQSQNPYHGCRLKFSLFRRRHHCRRCGMVVCQRHSGNRLPLFDAPYLKGKWSRVCDDCFYQLIVQK
ncbi:hypothetical protein BD560DRAFT_214822 [Blakeslea trispora]|nr:hypothetical protein BD560DRAFT_214822 [Blakeslea trispora]